MKKKVFANLIFICITVILLTATSLSISAAKSYTYEYYTYTVANDKATITDVNTDISGKVNVPSTLGGYTVVSIGDSAFEDCIRITAVTIPDSVTKIDRYAFNRCSAMSSLSIGNNIETIGIYAFSACTGLKNLTIPDSVTEIGNATFKECTRLSSVTIGNGLTTIPQYCFYGCTALKSVSFGYNLNIVRERAFADCSALDSITMSENMKEIGRFAFENSGIVSVKFNNTFTTIGYGSFQNCKNLTKVVIPDGVTSIDGFAFSGCDSLSSAEIGDGVTIIPDNAFSYSGLTSVSIGNNVTDIKDYAFCSCENLKNINWNEKISKIGSRAFRECKSLKSVSVPETVVILGDQAFYQCSGIESVTLGPNVIKLEQYTFYECKSLKSVVIYGDLISVGETSFGGCTRLNEIYLPQSLQSIAPCAFGDCDSLNRVYFEGSEDDWNLVIISDFLDDNDDIINATKYFNTPAPDLSIPTAFINSTNDLAAKQTVTIDLADNREVKGYYWGKNEDYKQNKYTETSEEQVTLTVSEHGTYHLIVCDINGNISNPHSVTYYKTTFDPTNGTLPETMTSDYIISLSEQPITLPIPTKKDAAFMGWNIDSSAIDGIKTVSPEADTTYYAIWETMPSIDTLSSISIATAPYTTSFNVFDSFNSNGLTINAQFNNGSSFVIEDGFTVSGYDITRPGEQTVSVTYGSKTTTYTITVSVPKTFDDVNPNAWYAAQIFYCYDKGYINGMTTTTFKPNDTLTRAQFVIMLAKVASADLSQYSDTESGFNDVKKSHWFHDAITWAAKNNYVSGIGNGKFGPSQNITREQLARLFFNYASVNNIDTTKKADLSAFADAVKISSWAYEPVQWAVAAGLINGMSPVTIAPRSSATRAQAATIFMRFDQIRISK